MTKFEEFKAAFNEKFDGSIYEFINYGDASFGAKLVEDLDVEAYNSYGDEDSTLERIYFIEDFGIYVMFEGTRCSYQGEEWDGFKEVKQVQKTITVWN